MRPAFIPVGQIVNAHGIRGEVKVNPHGFDPEFLTEFDTIYIDGQPVRVRSARVHKSTVLMALPGVDDMDAALALKGKTVSIRRTDAHLPQGQYFDQELVGLRVIDCATGETLYRKQLDAKYVPQLCAFAREQGVVIITYNKQGVVTESPEDKWALKECFTCKLPMQKVEDLAAYVDYPICKMLITLDPARRGEVLEAGRKQFAGEIDLYPSSPFFIEAVPLGVAKDVSLGSLLESRGLTRDNLMACGDGLNDCSMIRFAGVGVAMQNAEPPVKEAADYVTVADNNHDGVAEAIEKFIF